MSALDFEVGDGLDDFSFFFQAKNRARDEDDDDADVLAGMPY